MLRSSVSKMDTGSWPEGGRKHVGDEIRGAQLTNVHVRVSGQYALEMHIDVDEANAVGAKNGDFVTICKCEQTPACKLDVKQ